MFYSEFDIFWHISIIVTSDGIYLFRFLNSLQDAKFAYALSHLVISDFLQPHELLPPGSSAVGIFQATILAGDAISHSSGSSHPRDQTHISFISCTGRQIVYHCATWEVLKYKLPLSNADINIQVNNGPPKHECFLRGLPKE